MSVKCFIGIKYEWGVTGIRCNNFGQPSITGDILIKHYNDSQKAVSLIELGNIVSLGKWLCPALHEYHTYGHPSDDVTVACFRDKRDYWSSCAPRSYISEREANDSMGDLDWVYVFGPVDSTDTHSLDKGTWYCAKVIRDFYDPCSEDVYLGDSYLSKLYPLKSVIEEGEDIFGVD